MSLIANSSAQISSDGNGNNSASQVSGSTVFWALLALALNAMGQDSPTTRKLFGVGRIEEGLLTPTLSSPIFCLVDICVDCYLIALALFRFKYRDTPTESMPDSDSLPSKIGPLVAVRILLIVFGVVPQAVRLYGMSGIPLTQVVATIYLATSLLRLLRIRIQPPEEEEENEEENEDEESNETTSSDEPFPALALALVIIGPGFLFLSHFFAYNWLLNGVSRSLYINHQNPIKKDLVLAFKIFSAMCYMLCALGSSLWIVCILLDIIRPLQRRRPIYLWFVAFTVSYICSLIEAMTEETSEHSYIYISFSNFSMNSIISAVAVACLFAILLKLLLEVANGQFRNINNIDAASMELADNGNRSDTVGLLRNDLESVNADPTVTDQTEHTVIDRTRNSSEDESNDPLYRVRLYSDIAFSFLIEKSVATGQDLLPKYPNLADPVYKCRLIAYCWRRVMMALPLGVVFIISRHKLCAGSTSSIHTALSTNADGEHSNRNPVNTQSEEEPQSSLSHFFCELRSLVVCSTLQAIYMSIALFLAFPTIGKLSRRAKNFYNRYLAENWTLIFALLNLITAGVRCIYLWDGTGTLMPSWESWLG